MNVGRREFLKLSGATAGGLLLPGGAALAAMRAEKPDVVLLDIMMSYVLDGVDVTHEMAEDPVLKDIPVIMVTSLASTPDADVFPTDEHISVDGWMSKPIKPDELLAEIDRVTKE